MCTRSLVKEIRWRGLLGVLLVIGKDLLRRVLEIRPGLPWRISVPLIPRAIKYSLVLVVVAVHAAVDNLAHVPFLMAFRIARVGDNDWGFGVGYLAGEGVVRGKMELLWMKNRGDTSI
jgi:hypothetical protein